MGQKAKKDEIYFNYPIPREVHQRLRVLGAQNDWSVKDMVVVALLDFLEKHER